MPTQVITLIVVGAIMFLVIGGLAFLSHYYTLDGIKSKTVGDGQHGTARWATKQEIRQTYAHVPFEPELWRKGEHLPEKQGLVLGCEGPKDHVTALVDTDDIHAMVTAASGAGKTAFFLYPNIEYALASGMSFLCTDTKGDLFRNYHKLKLGQETVLRPVLSQLQELRERELRSNRKISDIDNEIARISEQNLVLVRLKSKEYVDSALYLSQMDEIDRKLRELRKLRRRLLEAAGEDRQIHDTERMMEYLEDGPEWLDEVPAELFGELIERIIIISPERLKFRLLNGMELAENIERTVR